MAVLWKMRGQKLRTWLAYNQGKQINGTWEKNIKHQISFRIFSPFFFEIRFRRKYYHKTIFASLAVIILLLIIAIIVMYFCSKIFIPFPYFYCVIWITRKCAFLFQWELQMKFAIQRVSIVLSANEFHII